MVDQHRPRLLITVVILCLCFGSLVMFTVLHPIHPGTPDPTGAYSETHDHFFQPGTEEGFYIPVLVGVAVFGLVISRQHSLSLCFCSIWLTPQIPPPKFA
jgi:hypothetical protein